MRFRGSVEMWCDVTHFWDIMRIGNKQKDEASMVCTVQVSQYKKWLAPLRMHASGSVYLCMRRIHVSQILNKCHRHHTTEEIEKENTVRSASASRQPSPKPKSWIGLFRFASQKLLFARRDIYHIKVFGRSEQCKLRAVPTLHVGWFPNISSLWIFVTYISTLSSKMIFGVFPKKKRSLGML